VANVLHFTLGPVQGFVAQARRTRDLWAGSFLLSYLAGHAMKAVLESGGSIVFPNVGSREKPTDPLLAAILGKPLRENPTPTIGSIPNRFKAEVLDGFEPTACRDAVMAAWREVADKMWKRYFSDLDGTPHQEVWQRQVEGFWDMSWVMGQDPGDRSDNAWLDRRKNWRSHTPPPQPGDKCTLMTSWQELSGHERATQGDKQRDFWKAMRGRVPSLDLGEHERLCAIALIKRLFPRVSEEAIGWKLEVASWPSTSYMAAVPWLREIQEGPEDVRQLALEYPNVVRDNIKEGYRGEYNTDLVCLRSNPFTQLDGQLYFRHAIESDKERGLSADAKRELQSHLQRLNEAVGHPPSPFYALLLMDGDSLGTLLQNVEKPEQVSTALAHFTEGVDAIVKKHCGKTVYAGGDDVLALLPLDRALEAATALRKSYLDAFDGVLGNERPNDDKGKPLKTTISAGLVFAHYHTSLRAVMKEAHYLLDEVAKDGNGRDSIAVSVLTGSGRTVEWVSSWDEANAPRPVTEIVQDLVTRFEKEEQFASKFFYNVRSRFEILTGDEATRRASGYKLTEGIDAGRLLVAEYQKSRERNVPLRDAEERVGQLLRVCRVRKNGREDIHTLNVEGAMLVRFLATKGRGVER
jgi:CRISPR-associated protein Cmr2